MCMNCVSTTEAAFLQAALVGYVVKDPVHRLLARCGVAAAPDPVARDVRTVAFLRSLDLDPGAILGDDVVTAADGWMPAPQPQSTGGRWRTRLASWALPIGSHSLLTTQ
jgi:hypothetical protein